MTFATAAHEAKLRTWKFALDHRPHVLDEPFDPILIGRERAIPNQADPWHIGKDARVRLQGVSTIWDDMNPALAA
jgi:hypothetical protein